MRRRGIVYAPEAADDLLSIYDWIAARAGDAVAFGYVQRVEGFCDSFDLASERGILREDI